LGLDDFKIKKLEKFVKQILNKDRIQFFEISRAKMMKDETIKKLFEMLNANLK
jgi:hypothetical protein